MNAQAQGPASDQELADLLKGRDIFPTLQRVQIARILFACPQHLSADQVMIEINREGAHVSKATIYNTLGLLASRGLVREVFVDPARVVYDSNTAPHHHLYNVDSGELTDIALDGLSLEEFTEIPDDVVPVGVEVIIRVRNRSPNSSVTPDGSKGY